jgi:hypothetical protein
MVSKLTNLSNDRQALRRVARAAKARERADGEFRAAIREARAEGVTVRRIGEAAGVSHVRVIQILKEER